MTRQETVLYRMTKKAIENCTCTKKLERLKSDIFAQHNIDSEVHRKNKEDLLVLLAKKYIVLTNSASKRFQ